MAEGDQAEEAESRMTEGSTEEGKPTEASGFSNPLPLFNKNEVHGMVRDFVWAYLNGSITINWMTDEEAKQLIERDVGIYGALKNYSEVQKKREFTHQISICSGATSATESEFDSAITQIFDSIVALRTSRRIKGSFLQSQELENRTKELEDQMSATTELLQSFLTWKMIVNAKLNIQ
jgi:hypothetical protein